MEIIKKYLESIQNEHIISKYWLMKKNQSKSWQIEKITLIMKECGHFEKWVHQILTLHNAWDIVNMQKPEPSMCLKMTNVNSFLVPLHSCIPAYLHSCKVALCSPAWSELWQKYVSPTQRALCFETPTLASNSDENDQSWIGKQCL